MDDYKNHLIIGRAEWCSLPGFGIPGIKAKVDTGARTSALHAINITPKDSMVYFDIQPVQDDDSILVACQAPIHDERKIMSSNGSQELRYIILTQLTLGSQTWEVELSLSDRDPLKFRMLLGRQALKQHVLVDPASSCLTGVPPRKVRNLWFREP